MKLHSSLPDKLTNDNVDYGRKKYPVYHYFSQNKNISENSKTFNLNHILVLLI